LKQPTKEALEAALRSAWCSRTSADPERWTPERPETGQCAVTTLVLQDYLGGELWRCLVAVDGWPPSSHYYHVGLEEQVTDLTWSQFPESAFSSEHASRPRSYVLGFPATMRRYLELRDRVEELLRGE
jgi:hypothetical protein